MTFGTGTLMRLRDHKIQRNKGMNNLHWVYSDNIGDSYIAMESFKYVDYEDAAMVPVKIFNKRK